MNRTQIAIALALRELEVDPARDDNFRTKKNALYLMKAAGAEVSSHFFWWHYSGTIGARRLSDDFLAMRFGISSEFDETDGWQLDKASKTRIAGIKALVQSADLELFTSTHFLITRGQAKNDADVREVLSKYGRNYTPKEIGMAVKALRQYGLLPAH
jgi:hypothetical protein